MTTINRTTALMLVAVGPLAVAGGAIHPHAPDAQTMAAVAYVQTGQVTWWPSHVCLLAAEALFAAFLVRLSRENGLSPRTAHLLRVLVPLAWLAVGAMVVHLLLPLGRDSVAGGHLGWAFWVKDVVEGLDAVFAGCMVLVAWALWRDGIVSSRILGLLGMAGGTVFLVFSLGIPLTPTLISMDVAHALIPAVPVVGVLASASWAIGSGVRLARRDQADHTAHDPGRRPAMHTSSGPRLAAPGRAGGQSSRSALSGAFRLSGRRSSPAMNGIGNAPTEEPRTRTVSTDSITQRDLMRRPNSR